MFLIVGLGNPGQKYENTRHNIGFRAVDEIAANFQFSIFNFQSKLNVQISKGEIAGKKVILAKPQTFMNLSGKTVKFLNSKFKISRFHRGSPMPISSASGQNSKLLIIHDDIDLPMGKIKISIGRGSAGHKGVESIIRELKTKDFVRFRVGINAKLKAKSEKQQLKTKKLENFVLEKFSKDEEKIVQKVIKKTCEAIELYLESGLEKTMSKYNF